MHSDDCDVPDVYNCSIKKLPITGRKKNSILPISSWDFHSKNDSLFGYLMWVWGSDLFYIYGPGTPQLKN